MRVCVGGVYECVFVSMCVFVTEIDKERDSECLIKRINEVVSLCE